MLKFTSFQRHRMRSMFACFVFIASCGNRELSSNDLTALPAGIFAGMVSLIDM